MVWFYSGRALNYASPPEGWKGWIVMLLCSCRCLVWVWALYHLWWAHKYNGILCGQPCFGHTSKCLSFIPEFAVIVILPLRFFVCIVLVTRRGVTQESVNTYFHSSPRDTVGLHCRDTEGGHCQGGCHHQWFFYISLKASEMTPPFTWSCEPREIHSVQRWRARTNLSKPLTQWASNLGHHCDRRTHEHCAIASHYM